MYYLIAFNWGDLYRHVNKHLHIRSAPGSAFWLPNVDTQDTSLSHWIVFVHQHKAETLHTEARWGHDGVRWTQDGCGFVICIESKLKGFLTFLRRVWKSSWVQAQKPNGYERGKFMVAVEICTFVLRHSLQPEPTLWTAHIALNGFTWESVCSLMWLVQMQVVGSDKSLARKYTDALTAEKV